MMNNLRIYRHWGLGFVEEVMNGKVYEPSGVCPHQCWSETMVIQPAIEGMLGIDVDAGAGRLTLAPRIPAHWDSLNVERIRVGERMVDLRYRKEKGVHRWDFRQRSWSAMQIEFMPSLPAGSQIIKATLNGEAIPLTIFQTGDHLELYLSFKGTGLQQLVIETNNGVAALPVVEHPEPGSAAAGLRILGTRYSGNEYQLDLEGPGGSTGMLEVWMESQNVDSIEGGTLRGSHNGTLRIEVPFGGNQAGYATSIVKIRLKARKL